VTAARGAGARAARRYAGRRRDRRAGGEQRRRLRRGLAADDADRCLDDARVELRARAAFKRL
jgi:hypothetical protein